MHQDYKLKTLTFRAKVPAVWQGNNCNSLWIHSLVSAIVCTPSPHWEWWKEQGWGIHTNFRSGLGRFPAPTHTQTLQLGRAFRSQLLQGHGASCSWNIENAPWPRLNHGQQPSNYGSRAFLGAESGPGAVPLIWSQSLLTLGKYTQGQNW